MSRRLVIVVAAAALAAVTLAGAPASAIGEFRPPYANGPQGGDSSNFMQRDAASGRITVLRAYPQPGAFNCGGAGGFSSWRVTAPATGSETAVVVSFADAAFDSYTWVAVLVRSAAGDWLGGVHARGPRAGSGTVTVPLAGVPSSGTMSIQFGIEVASACPSLDGGTARFAAVTLY